MDVERNEVYISDGRRTRRYSGLLKQPINEEDGESLQTETVENIKSSKRRPKKVSATRTSDDDYRPSSRGFDSDKENNYLHEKRNERFRRRKSTTTDLLVKLNDLELEDVQKKSAEIQSAKVEIDEFPTIDDDDDDCDGSFEERSKDSVFVKGNERHRRNVVVNGASSGRQTNNRRKSPNMKKNKLTTLNELNAGKASFKNDTKFKAQVLNKIKQDQELDKFDKIIGKKSETKLVNKGGTTVKEPVLVPKLSAPINNNNNNNNNKVKTGKNLEMVLVPLKQSFIGNEIIQLLQKTKQNAAAPSDKSPIIKQHEYITNNSIPNQNQNQKNRRFSDRIKQIQANGKPNEECKINSFVTVRPKKSQNLELKQHTTTTVPNTNGSKVINTTSTTKSPLGKRNDSKLNINQALPNNNNKPQKLLHKQTKPVKNEQSKLLNTYTIKKPPAEPTPPKKITTTNEAAFKKLSNLDNENEILYYYLNDHTSVMEKSTCLETIYEQPHNYKGLITLMSTNKYKRFINFADYDHNLYSKKQRKRMKKAKEIARRSKDKCTLKVSDEYFQAVLSYIDPDDM